MTAGRRVREVGMRSAAGDLVGREDELVRAAALLGLAPVLTVTGVGGVGKTRFARALVEAARSEGRHAAVCELAGIADPAAVPYVAADALGYPSLDAAAVGLDGRAVLLLVDNCEHLLDPAADTVARVLESCSGVTVLATSREPLDVPGEHVLALGGLTLPAHPEAAVDSPAVRLLIERVVAVGARIDLDDEATAGAVVELCRRLDGLPLAIELAAARMRSLTAGEVLGHLEDRLALLSRDRPRGPERHRSLEAAIGWSYDRLPAATAAFFDRLAVFGGRFTAEAAHDVAGTPGTALLDSVGLLDQLVAQSLVTVETVHGRSWYGLLETLRSFARSRLVARGELDAVRNRWIDAMVATTDEIRHRMLTAWSNDLMITLKQVYGDVEAALRWCISHDAEPDRALPLFVPMCSMLKLRSALPLADLGDLLLDRWPEDRPGRWSEAAAAAGLAHVLRGSVERGTVLADRAIAHSGSGLAEVNARRVLYYTDRMAGRDAAALRRVEEAIEHARAHDMTPWHIELLTFRAATLASLRRHEEAITQIGAAYRAASALGTPILEAWTAAVQGALIALRDPITGRATLTEALARCDRLDYTFGAALCRRALGALALLDGRLPEAAGLLRAALEGYVSIDHAAEIRVTLRWVARLAAQAGRPDPAEALRRSAGSVRGDVLEDVWEPVPVPGRPGPAGAGESGDVDLARAVITARRELSAVVELGEGAAPVPDRGAASAGPAGAEGSELRRDGAVWTLTFAGSTVRLPDAKGLQDLAVLLSRPGREVHSAELMGAAVEQSDTGPMLDERARREYKARVLELQQELAEAEDMHDRGRAEKAATEMELLLAELSAATGLGGRTRRTGGNTERTRSAVTWRIRSAIKRIEAGHPALGAHLQDAVRTGTWCSYAPDPLPRWVL